MAKIHKLFKKGVLLYPLTILQAVFDPESKKDLKEVLDEKSGVPEEKALAEALSNLDARIKALERIHTGILSKVEIEGEFNLFGETNLILKGEGAASFAPDFIGQLYIDTAGENIYVAVNNINAGNWKLV